MLIFLNGGKTILLTTVSSALRLGPCGGCQGTLEFNKYSLNNCYPADTGLGSGERRMSHIMVAAHKHLTTLQRQALTAVERTKLDSELVGAQVLSLNLYYIL